MNKKAIWNDIINFGLVTTPLAVARMLVQQTAGADSWALQFATRLILGLLVIWLIWLAIKWVRSSGRSSLPWYVVLGMTDTGKTTLLKQSGVHEIPAATGPIKDLDSYLASRTIALEDAGVYVTYDMVESDRDEWLDLLEIISICFTLVEAGNKAQNDGEIRPQLTHMALKLGPNLLNLLGVPDSLRELTRFTSF